MASRAAPLAAVLLLLLAGSAAAARNLQQSGPSSSSPYVQALSGFLPFDIIFRTGDFTPSSALPVGTLVDISGRPLRYRGSGAAPNPWGYDISPNPDFSSLHTTAGGNVFSITQFESENPATAYVAKLTQGADGSLTPEWFKPTDWSAYGGLWTPCAGSVTPWGTHAGGEEYEPDAYCVHTSTDLAGLRACLGDISAITNMMRYQGFNPDNATFNDIRRNFNPYLYGHAFEIGLSNDNGDSFVGKHYTMGRHSYELWIGMPDNRTTYSADDGAATAFWKFVADTPGDMSSGNLYGAKFYQQSAAYGGDFKISWIHLGHGNNQELLSLVRSGITFNDIFDSALPVNNTCPAGYKMISKRDNRVGATCLLLKPGMEMAAAFLESRRYLLYVGGSAELTKFEGLSFDPVTHKLYGAMSVIRNSMEDNMSLGTPSTAWDYAGPNDIRVPYNPCGCVYAFDVLPGSYDVTSMYGEVCGIPTTRGTLRNEGRCDQAGIAEPDNVVPILHQGQLIIGEDTNENRIDSMWLYDLRDKTLTRIFTSPYGAETTSPYWFTNFPNGWSYLGAAVQHPYGESDQTKVSEANATGLAGYVGAWGFRTADFANGEKLKFAAIPYPAINDVDAKHHVTTSGAAYRYATSTPMVDMPMHNMTGQSLPGPAAV